MPKLNVFAPCENVLIGQSQDASLIVLLHQLTHTLGDEVPDPIPAGAATQMKWYVFAQWEKLDGDDAEHFEQKISFVNSDKKETFTSVTEFSFGDKPLQRMIAQFTFFPLVPEGHYRLKVLLRKQGEQQWQEHGDYPMEILYKRVPQGALVHE